MPAALYSDISMFGGGSRSDGFGWAWRRLDAQGRVEAKATPLAFVMSCAVRQAELWGMLKAVAAVRDGWTGEICMDSRAALDCLKNPMLLPTHERRLVRAAARRLGRVNLVACHGHPTDLQLRLELPVQDRRVSRHMVWCDQVSRARRIAWLRLVAARAAVRGAA